jgi:hypothetical protein
LSSLSEPGISCKGAAELVHKECATAGLLGGSFYLHLSSRRKKVVEQRIPLEEENRRLEISVEICEIPMIVGSWGSYARFSPLAQEVRPNAHRGSAFGGWRGKSLYLTKSRVAIS